ncbi:uncharacterized protein [Musca autumnalis]|uniref:uncharacterized protein n=1 Tax=Musca autumnalis TaxID=221902 RepID=UPI003CE6B750
MLQFKFLSFYSWVLVAIMGLVSLAQGEIFNIDDITVETKTNNFRCDRITCPPTANRCVVTKTTKSKDLAKVKRENICYSIGNEILQKSKTYETVSTGIPINFHLDVDHNGKVNTLAWDKPKKSSSDLDKIKRMLLKKVNEMKNKLDKKAMK